MLNNTATLKVGLVRRKYLICVRPTGSGAQTSAGARKHFVGRAGLQTKLKPGQHHFEACSPARAQLADHSKLVSRAMKALHALAAMSTADDHHQAGQS